MRGFFHFFFVFLSLWLMSLKWITHAKRGSRKKLQLEKINWLWLKCKYLQPTFRYWLKLSFCFNSQMHTAGADGLESGETAVFSGYTDMCYWKITDLKKRRMNIKVFIWDWAVNRVTLILQTAHESCVSRAGRVFKTQSHA